MLVLNHLHCLAFIAEGPELGDVSEAEHVCIDEQGPALVAHQIGHEEAAEGKGRALQRILRPLIDRPQLFQAHLGDLHRQAGMGLD